MKHALRRLLASPGFTLTALVTLALGIGVNTSMFSVLNALLLRALPYPESERLVRINRTDPRSQTLPQSPANFLDHERLNQSFAAIAAFTGAGFTLAEPGQPATQLRGMYVTAGFFPVLGVSPIVGRVFTAEEDQPGRDGVVVLSEAFWRERFFGDPGVVGRQLRLDGQSVTVVGVMPAGFDDRLLWRQPAAWRPMAFTDQQRASRGGHYLGVIGRLRPDRTPAQAQTEMSTLAATLSAAHPATNAQSSVYLVSLTRSAQDDTTRMLSWFAMGLAGCVLLIACVNLANLQFARNAARSREHAVRAALGASRLSVIRHSLIESLLLSLTGGALGLLVAVWGNDALGARLAIAGQSGFAIGTDFRVLGFALAVAALTGVAFGILPAVSASRTDINEALKQGTRGTTSGAHSRTRRVLIVAEFALALVLLAGAGFFIRGLERYVSRDHGWQTGRVLMADVNLTTEKYSASAARVAFYDQVRTRLAALAGVEQVALSTSLPFASFSGGQRFVIEGQPAPAVGAEPLRLMNYVDPDFFATLGVPLVAGRAFTAADQAGPMRTIINETMARQFWPDLSPSNGPGESAIGKRIRHPTSTASTDWQEIVGVVRDVSFPTRLETATTPFQAYRLLAREPARYVVITLRSTLSAGTLNGAVRRVLAEIDPELPMPDLRPATAVIEQGLANITVIGWLLTGFAALGLLLAAVGIYGVIAGSVIQRTSEIGVRIALGAQVRDIFALVLGQGLALALLGTAIGLVGAFAVARLLSSMMPAMPAAEVATGAVVTLTLLAVALLACWLPARRATKVDPMTALRAE